MRFCKEKIIPERKIQSLDKIICDFCKQEIDLKENSYHEDRVKIQHKKGYNYPDNGHGEIDYVDMCSNCFSKKLVPWINSQGVQLQTKEWDW
jgi:hypothetical protein